MSFPKSILWLSYKHHPVSFGCGVERAPAAPLKQSAICTHGALQASVEESAQLASPQH